MLSRCTLFENQTQYSNQSVLFAKITFLLKFTETLNILQKKTKNKKVSLGRVKVKRYLIA